MKLNNVAAFFIFLTITLTCSANISSDVYTKWYDGFTVALDTYNSDDNKSVKTLMQGLENLVMLEGAYNYDLKYAKPSAADHFLKVYQDLRKKKVAIQEEIKQVPTIVKDAIQRLNKAFTKLPKRAQPTSTTNQSGQGPTQTQPQPTPQPTLTPINNKIAQMAEKIRAKIKEAHAAQTMDQVIAAYAEYKGILDEASQLAIYFTNTRTTLTAPEIAFIIQLQEEVEKSTAATRKKIAKLIKTRTVEAATFKKVSDSIGPDLRYGLARLDNATIKLLQALSSTLSIANMQNKNSKAESLMLFRTIKVFANEIIKKAQKEWANLKDRFSDKYAQEVTDEINALAATIAGECDDLIDEITGENANFIDYYAALGIPRDPKATDAQTIDAAKKAYRRMAMTHHPDKGGDEARFKEIQAAYQILTDKFTLPIYNKRYDRLVKRSAKRNAAPQPTQSAAQVPDAGPITPPATPAPSSLDEMD